MPPVFGMLSDNTRGSWGRRRPYIAAKALLLVLSALLLAVTGNIGSLMLAAWLLNQVSLTSVGSDIIRRGTSFFYVITAIVVLVGALITVCGIRGKFPSCQRQAELLRRKNVHSPTFVTGLMRTGSRLGASTPSDSSSSRVSR